ncbi:hypothetical protein [Thaumasiovibrio sp. DFM-14]|uniref:hypothetical protein n=1 Tax=Thaumasiovibrio sp. DFM-14 TaxID=3384792 RepID=UPI0039A1E081
MEDTYQLFRRKTIRIIRDMNGLLDHSGPLIDGLAITAREIASGVKEPPKVADIEKHLQELVADGRVMPITNDTYQLADAQSLCKRLIAD